MPYVYFIQESQSGAIKIGHSCNLPERLQTMKICNPHELNFLGAFSGGKREEKIIHKCFEQYHIKGEWFSPVQELLDFASYICIKNIASCPYSK